MPTPDTPAPKLDTVLHVLVTREPFIDYFTITLDNGHTEELDPEECRQWFKERGGNMDIIEKALDHCWNFYRVEVNIQNPKEPPMPKLAHAPKL
jgi:hypothetical protein